MMSVADFDAAWDMFFPKWKVTYIPYNPVTDQLDVSAKICNIDALILPFKKGEKSIGGGTEAYNVDRVWALRSSQMNGVVVTRRGIIQDETGKQWMVDSTQSLTFGSRWRCETVCLP